MVGKQGESTDTGDAFSTVNTPSYPGITGTIRLPHMLIENRGGKS